MTEDDAPPGVRHGGSRPPGPHKARTRAGETAPTPPANDPEAEDTPVTPETAAPAA